VDDIDQPDDRELWQRAVHGEPEAFGVLFDRHGERIRSYCARRTGSLEAADDLVSVVFLEAWRRRADVELLADSALPWLYGIANRTVQRRWRTTTRHRRALERLAATQDSAPDHADEVAGRVDDERQLARLREALAGLRRTDQEVLTLCLWQGLDYESAALALDLPVGTVRSRLSRARARLRDAVEPPLTAPGDRPASLLRMETR
jgi:RNA polymerase sigma factor (sigma-70 family)